MRNVLLAGTAGLFVSLAVAGAANAANPNTPTWSPYTLMYVPGSVPEVTPTSNPVWAYNRYAIEGRAAYIDEAPRAHRYRYNAPGQPDQIFGDGSSDSDHLINPDQ
ncbi:hypothetical protein [Methylocapsa sp. S129]|uniref:hypothetical protein n=1 Tax=Methylocapsa sp. S129 TaxID=1641869 RepID=UPI00131DC757|nr:hypothetical protein [Methylocapsa sp. S129]